MGPRTVHLDITGMSCANCSSTVQDALDPLGRVHETNVNFATDEGSVEYDLDVVTLREIYDAIEEAGYGVVREPVMGGVSRPFVWGVGDTDRLHVGLVGSVRVCHRRRGVVRLSVGASVAVDDGTLDAGRGG